MLKRANRADVEIVDEHEGIGASPELKDQIAKEMLPLSNPWCPGFPDAPLPSHRGDLRQEYAARRLRGEVGQDGIMELAAELLPTPDQQSHGAMWRVGHSLGPSYSDTHRAFKSIRKRKGRR